MVGIQGLKISKQRVKLKAQLLNGYRKLRVFCGHGAENLYTPHDNECLSVSIDPTQLPSLASLAQVDNSQIQPASVSDTVATPNSSTMLDTMNIAGYEHDDSSTTSFLTSIASSDKKEPTGTLSPPFTQSASSTPSTQNASHTTLSKPILPIVQEKFKSLRCDQLRPSKIAPIAVDGIAVASCETVEPVRSDQHILAHSKVGRRQKVKDMIKSLMTNDTQLSSRAISVDTADTKTDIVSETHNNDIDGERSDWDTIQAIPDVVLSQILLCGTDPGRKLKLADTRVVDRTNGSYNEVVMLQLYRHGKIEDFIIRVPAHGTPQLWTERDEYMMQREVELMMCLHLKTQVPVPEVIDFSTTIQKSVGFPYILMRKLPGATAYDIWFDDIIDYREDTAYLHADFPSAETERKRINFLRSLATIMTDLGQLHFDRIGVPIFDMGPFKKPPVIGPSYNWGRTEGGYAMIERPSFRTTQDFIDSAFSTTWNPAADRFEEMQTSNSWRNDEKLCRDLGVRKLLELLFTAPAFNCTGEEFTICHPDLDLQNILTDEDGNITGIIDWDGAFVGPRCISAAALPKFLNREWFPRSVAGMFSAPHTGWRQEYYRNMYADFMIKSGSLDAHLTSKSAIYASVLAGLLGICGGGDIYDFVEKLLRKTPAVLADPLEFMICLGRGWPAAESMLAQSIADLLDVE